MIQDKSNKDKIYEALKALILKHALQEGKQRTSIGNLSLLKVTQKTELIHSIYEPSLIVIIQGSKIVILGDKTYHYGKYNYLVSSVNLPVQGQILEATEQEPYLCLQVTFNLEQISELLASSNIETSSEKVSSAQSGLCVQEIEEPLLMALLRLVQLLDTPEHSAVLAPMITKEVLYWMLVQDRDQVLRRFSMTGSHSATIRKIIQQMVTSYEQPLEVEQLAKAANMSVSNFYAQFKMVTAMSPLQYQKVLRLQEARRRLLSEGIDAAQVSFEVGYSSPSQFSREYAKFFGKPPITDTKHAKEVLLSLLNLI